MSSSSIYDQLTREHPAYQAGFAQGRDVGLVIALNIISAEWARQVDAGRLAGLAGPRQLHPTSTRPEGCWRLGSVSPACSVGHDRQPHHAHTRKAHTMSTTDDLVTVTARIKPETHAQFEQLRHWVNRTEDNAVVNSDSQLLGWLIENALRQMHAGRRGAARSDPAPPTT